MTNVKMMHVGGWSLIVFALSYLGVQLALILLFNYHAISQDLNAESLKLISAGGGPLQAMLAIFALLPLLLIPGSVGAYYAFKDIDEPGMRLGVLFATLAAFAFSLCLMRWPTFNWYITQFFGQAAPKQQVAINAIFHGLNNYFGVFLGGIFVNICSSIWFFFVSCAMLASKQIPKWMGYLGIIAAVYLLLALILHFSGVPAIVVHFFKFTALIEFLWLVIFGVSLLFYETR